MNDTCDRCGKTDEGISWFGPAYRKNELKHGRPDPGTLCGDCAGHDTGIRLAAEDHGADCVCPACMTRDDKYR